MPKNEKDIDSIDSIESIKKFRSASKEDDFRPRRTFRKGEINEINLEIDDEGKIVAKTEDAYGNKSFQDKFGNKRNFAKEDEEVGLSPNINYQDEYEMTRRIDKHGDMKGYIDIGQEKVLENIAKNSVAITSGDNIGGYLPKTASRKDEILVELEELTELTELTELEEIDELEELEEKIPFKQIKQIKQIKQTEEKNKTINSSLKEGMGLFCKNCKCTEITINSNFCPNCGQKFI